MISGRSQFTVPASLTLSPSVPDQLLRVKAGMPGGVTTQTRPLNAWGYAGTEIEPVYEAEPESGAL